MMVRGFYAILDVRQPLDSARPEEAELTHLVARAHRLLLARPCMLQLRAKSGDPAPLAMLARAVHPAARAAGVPLCVNDRLDVALAVGAEAVHLGQDDLPLADARAVARGSPRHWCLHAHPRPGGASGHPAGPTTSGSDLSFPPAPRRIRIRWWDSTVCGRSRAPWRGRPVRYRSSPSAASRSTASPRSPPPAPRAAALISAVENAADPAAAGLAVNAAFGV